MKKGRSLMNRVLAIAMLLTVLTGCKKETTGVADGERVEKELQQVIETSNIKRVLVVTYGELLPGLFPELAGTVWSFSNGFIHVNANDNNRLIHDWNLDMLVGYSISNVTLENGSTDLALLLYMR